MTVRSRLVAATFLLQVLSMAGLGWGVLIIQKQLQERDVESSARVIESTITRAALEALLQKDDLQLISYVNFAKSQYPAVVYARIDWRSSERVRTHTLGGGGRAGAVRETRLRVENPADRTRDVTISMGVDRDVLEMPFADSRRRLSKIILAAWAVTSLLGFLISFYLARSFTRPLDALGRLADDIGKGKLGARLEWESDDEIGRLVRVFNMMSSRLEELDSAKRNFVSSVTHELRSPLGAIESFLQLIREKIAAGGPEGLRQSDQYLERIAVNVTRLSGFINDLLDVAKIEKGKMECVLRPMDLAPVAHDVCQFFEAKAGQQGVKVVSKVNGLPPILGDSDRLRQVLVNLVSNGLKFTPTGGRIEIGAEQVREGGQRWVEVAVIDTGRGMDEADRTRLFSPFSQGRNTSDGVTGHKGTGLGLFIVKSIIDQHGGKIDVSSVPGQGTRIRFSLKAA